MLQKKNLFKCVGDRLKAISQNFEHPALNLDFWWGKNKKHRIFKICFSEWCNHEGYR
jgi:hypothetical protein